MRSTILSLACLLPIGCISTPPSDNPLLLRHEAVRGCENPVLISPGEPSPTAYAEVFEKVLNVVEDYFEIAYANRYDGRIICTPKSAPGLEQPWKTGSPDARERLYASLQTLRYRCIVQIRAAEQSGYLVQVTVYRELADDPRPSGAPSVPILRDTQTVDRQFQVVDPTFPEAVWIPKGRESALEDSILQRIRKFQFE